MSNLYIEKYQPVIRLTGGLKTKLPMTLSGTAATLAVGGTLAVTGASTFTGAVSLPATVTGSTFDLTFDVVAASVNKWVFVADRAYTVTAIKEVHSVVGGSAALVKIRRVTAAATDAPGAAASATVIEYVTAGIDLTTTINVAQTATLVTGATVTLAAGDKIGTLFSGTLTGLVGSVTLTLTAV